MDDGSTDNTSEQARSAGAEVIRNETSSGKGAALSVGWRRALEQGYEFALTMDGDGQHAPGDIPQFLSCPPAHLVIGNRMVEGHKIPRLRRFVNRWMSRKLSRIAGRELPDTQCGFRLVNLPSWAQLRIETTHFEIESEVLLAFIAAGHRVEFVPIEVIYKDERSKIRPVRDSIRWFKWFLGLSRAQDRIRSTSPCVEKPVVSA